MTSSAHDRLIEVYKSYADAYDRRAGDLAAAQTPDQVSAILANVNTLECADLEAARAAVDAAYQAAKGIVEKIRLVGGVAKKATALVKAAQGS